MIYMNIKDFGAKGDGKTDDTKALEKALQEVAKENGTLYFPEGNYMINPIKVPSHITLMGNSSWGGANKSSPNSLGKTRLTALSGDSRALLDLDASIGTRIIGLTLDGQNLGKEMHGIYSCHGGVEQNNCYEDCLICNFTGCGLKMDLVWVFAIRRCMICDNKLHGIDVDRGYDGWVIDNYIINNGLWGVNAGPGMVCYTSNTIAKNNSGGMLADDTQNINVTGNSFFNNSGPAILINNSRASTITGNTAIGNGVEKVGLNSCGFMITDSVGIAIMGNTISSSKSDNNTEISAEYGIVAHRLTDCTIVANSLSKSAKTELLNLDKNINCAIEHNVGSITA